MQDMAQGPAHSYQHGHSHRELLDGCKQNTLQSKFQSWYRIVLDLADPKEWEK